MTKVTKEKCTGCPVFDNTEYQSNMLENNVCHKRDTFGCTKNEVKKCKKKK